MRRRLRVLLITGVVVLAAGCGTSRSYQFYPDASGNENTTHAQDATCGHVDLVIVGKWDGAEDHFEIGHFCKDNR